MYLVTLLCTVVTAAGFIVLHYALSHKTAELKVAGWVLVIGGIANAFAAIYAPLPAPAPMMPFYNGGHMRGGEMCHGKEAMEEKHGHHSMMPPADSKKP